MGKFRVKAFGAAKDILGGRETVIEGNFATVEELRRSLNAKFPDMLDLKSIMIAVNHVYAEDAQTLTESDEIALIPPVSGG